MHTQPILIVGAGPVGLSTALFLQHAGCPVRIVDANEAPTTLSKALVLWHRSLTVLDPVVPVERFLEFGTRIHGARFFNQGAQVATLPLEAPGHHVPAGLLIPQSAVEALLVQTLEARGVRVERRTQLTAFEQTVDGVRCTLEGPRGTQSFSTPYLAACDGAHSTVRHQLGIAFPGEAVPHRWLLGDLDVAVSDGVNPHAPGAPSERDIEAGWIHLSSSDAGAIALFPIAPGRHRVIVDAGPAELSATRQDPPQEELQTAIHRRTRLQWRVLRSHWLAEFRVHERQVADYVHDRVVLAGDAAHVHSPAGGQGMNTGIQDAANLGWKLALVASGAAGPDLLASYHAERHPVAAAVLRMSGRMLRASMATHPAIRHLRDLAMAAALHVPAVRHRAAAALTEDDIQYLDSPLNGTTTSAGSVTPGHWIPDLESPVAHGPASSLQWLRGRPGTLGTLILGP
ncbi:MAG: FAD-dependent monooxygenase, partial [Verrucomicrobia bacterium]|nr:FAD-dependent monooxygenase [Verrucomicrobiota bacterium]